MNLTAGDELLRNVPLTKMRLPHRALVVNVEFWPGFTAYVFRNWIYFYKILLTEIFFFDDDAISNLDRIFWRRSAPAFGLKNWPENKIDYIYMNIIVLSVSKFPPFSETLFSYNNNFFRVEEILWSSIISDDMHVHKWRIGKKYCAHS